MNKKNQRFASALFSALFLLSSASQVNAASTIKISEAGNGKTFAVKAGSTIEITLHSTFWSEQSSSNLKAIGAPNMKAIMPGPTVCKLPYWMGCLTLVWHSGRKPWKASFLATRTCAAKPSLHRSNRKIRIAFKVS